MKLQRSGPTLGSKSAQQKEPIVLLMFIVHRSSRQSCQTIRIIIKAGISFCVPIIALRVLYDRNVFTTKCVYNIYIYLFIPIRLTTSRDANKKINWSDKNEKFTLRSLYDRALRGNMNNRDVDSHWSAGYGRRVGRMRATPSGVRSKPESINFHVAGGLRLSPDRTYHSRDERRTGGDRKTPRVKTGISYYGF